MLPKNGEVYTYAQIADGETLELRDAPCLLFMHNDVECVIQTSHVSSDELLQNETWRDSRWVFERETDEWIPVFWYVGDGQELVDIETRHLEPRSYWVTPKGFPRSQPL